MGEQLEKFQHVEVTKRRDRRVITHVIASDLALSSCSFIRDRLTNEPSQHVTVL